ncbi:MAG: ATP-binding protein [Anaerolineae bacterium]
MQDADIQELQKETFVVVALIIGIVALGLAYWMLVLSQVRGYYYWVWWLPTACALVTLYASGRFYQRDRFRHSTYIFVGGLILSVTTFMVWPDTSYFTREIYLLLPVIAIAGLLITPLAAIQAANFAAVVSVAATLFVFGFSWYSLPPLIFPMLMVYSIAAMSWVSSSNLTTTLQWAFNSQARARQRSQELFESQLELKRAYQLLETTNIRLAQAEAEARQVSEFKTRFITNLSHELRTPLSAIINFSYILLKKKYGDVTSEQGEYLGRIQDAGELLLQITNDLLDLAKIEAGQMDLFIEPVDLTAVGTSVLSTTAGLLTDKPVELRQEFSPDLPLIHADETRVRQILLNLLGNAAKYTDTGSITLRMQPHPEGRVKISVIDTGIGIREEDFERIFEEFQQTEEAFTLRKTGTGLGLPISRKFAELHGGRLWVESIYRQGTSFHLLLPVNAAADTASPQMASPKIDPQPELMQPTEVTPL